VLPVQATYVGIETAVVTDDLSFSYQDGSGVTHTADPEVGRTDSLFDAPTLFPNSVAAGTVVLEVDDSDDLAGTFQVTLAATGQTVNFVL
jgi:hypothetical protein